MQLEQFNMQCGQILATEKLPNNQEGIKEYFQRAEVAGLPAAESINNWAQIQIICSECRTLNEQMAPASNFWPTIANVRCIF